MRQSRIRLGLGDPSSPKNSGCPKVVPWDRNPWNSWNSSQRDKIVGTSPVPCPSVICDQEKKPRGKLTKVTKLFQYVATHRLPSDTYALAKRLEIYLNKNSLVYSMYTTNASNSIVKHWYSTSIWKLALRRHHFSGTVQNKTDSERDNYDHLYIIWRKDTQDC